MKGDTAAAELAEDINAILALSLQAFTIRMKTTDSFNGKSVAQYQPGKNWLAHHEVTDAEREVQDRTTSLWDMTARQMNKNKDEQDGKSETGKPFKDTVTARLFLAHPMCRKYRYGEFGDEDFAITPTDAGLSAEKMAELAAEKMAELAAKFNTSEAQVLKSTAKTNRAYVQECTKKAWVCSSRMVAFVNVVKSHRRNFNEGAILVFAEFLSALDVAENALKEAFQGREALRVARFDGTVALKKCTEIVKDFEEGKFDIMFITSRSGGVGLTLIKANGIVHLIPTCNPRLWDQWSNRSIRIGQTQDVQMYHVYADSSIEQRIFLKQRQKSRKASKVVDPDVTLQREMGGNASWDFDQFR
ncbi:hypothetical protein P153DRAFT_382364 [Dothidotthia symphoricarpi CBS 119687]|uniref:Helicase C-terminal domain-containing protein n=1 Tax=Dothidotthia symphoricarpi CBS 119687 TaxID=1392245 RepID=A0A6A6AL85_9PLEO|nr:uncharacterized protein P153DRAFT_382364 [Dothidotthia symphoricarpi CBS 119687]KAF2132742.1 hypothetical protein P153DRAFT_382364 [Dothidotthia symphoricarpi CBS 119687]